MAEKKSTGSRGGFSPGAKKVIEKIFLAVGSKLSEIIDWERVNNDFSSLGRKKVRVMNDSPEPKGRFNIVQRHSKKLKSAHGKENKHV